MSDQYPTQPGPPGWTPPPPAQGGQAGWGQPPPSWSPPPGATAQQPTPPPARPWYKRGWFLVLVGFVAGGIVGSAGAGGSDPQATKTVTVTSVVERRFFTDDCTDVANQFERMRCERFVAGAKEAAAPTTTTPKPAATKPPAATIDEGEWAVPSEVRPGTYRTTGGENCYWSRLKGFSGQLEDIIANGNPTGPARVTIARSDKGFTTSGCNTWQKVG